MPSDVRQFYEKTREAKRVVLVDMGFLGDTLHLIPALWEVRRSYPGAWIEVLTSPVGKEVLGLVPGAVDNVRVTRWASGSGAGLREALGAAWGVWRESFDVAINFSGADRTLLFTALTGAQWRVACRGGRPHFWNRWLISHWTPPPDSTMPVYEQKRQMLAQCGMSLGMVKWDLQASPEAAHRAAQQVPAGAIHFSMNASTSLKEWPFEYWVELATRLLAAGQQVHIVATASGNLREQERLHRFEKAVQNPRLIALAPGLPIVELAAVLKRCRLHVGSDSGTLHLAVAAGIPTVSFFRESPGATGWIPKGREHRVFQVSCECMHQKAQPCHADGVSRCLATLSVDTVEREIFRCFADTAKKGMGNL